MAESVRVTVSGATELDRALREFAGPVINRALTVAFRNLRARGLKVWKLETPELTGATRRSLAAVVRVRDGSARLSFLVRPPALKWFARVERRHHNTQAVIKFLRAEAVAEIRRQLQRAIQEVGT